MRTARSFALLPLLLAITIAASAQDTVEVTKVIDGTTFVVSTGETIALLGVATPKSKAITAEDARYHLELMMSGGKVILISDSLVSDPQKGPKPRYVYTLNTDLVNFTMIADGYGAAAAKMNHSMAEEFRSAEKVARQGMEGAWSSERSTAVQCSATTKKGTQCKRTTTNISGKCWQHE